MMWFYCCASVLLLWFVYCLVLVPYFMQSLMYIDCTFLSLIAKRPVLSRMNYFSDHFAVHLTRSSAHLNSMNGTTVHSQLKLYIGSQQTKLVDDDQDERLLLLAWGMRFEHWNQNNKDKNVWHKKRLKKPSKKRQMNKNASEHGEEETNLQADHPPTTLDK